MFNWFKTTKERKEEDDEDTMDAPDTLYDDQDGEIDASDPDNADLAACPTAPSGSHIWGKWAVPYVPTNKDVVIQVRTCEGCGVAQARVVLEFLDSTNYCSCGCEED